LQYNKIVVDNPKCETASGCGEWKRPMMTNPKYKGKWVRPTIDNPDYKVRDEMYCSYILQKLSQNWLGYVCYVVFEI